MDGAGGGALPPQHRGATGVARLLHEAGIPSTDGASRARGVARQHRSSVYREPVTPEVQCLLPRRQIRECRLAVGTTSCGWWWAILGSNQWPLPC